MARQRSPNYPARDLEAAIDDADKLYKREQKAWVDSDVAVKAWGYNSLSGAARTRLGALNQYGLIETSSKRVRVSDRATTILLRQPGSHDYEAAVKAAALDPDIFRELNERFPDQGSDDAIRAYLVRERNFTRDGADKLISSFRATAEFANLRDGGYTPSGEGHEDAGDDGDDEMNGNEDGATQTWSWPLSPTVFAQVKLKGTGITGADIDTLSDYLDVVKKALERQAQADAGD